MATQRPKGEGPVWTVDPLRVFGLTAGAIGAFGAFITVHGMTTAAILTNLAVTIALMVGVAAWGGETGFLSVDPLRVFGLGISTLGVIGVLYQFVQLPTAVMLTDSALALALLVAVIAVERGHG